MRRYGIAWWVERMAYLRPWGRWRSVARRGRYASPPAPPRTCAPADATSSRHNKIRHAPTQPLHPLLAPPLLDLDDFLIRLLTCMLVLPSAAAAVVVVPVAPLVVVKVGQPLARRRRTFCAALGSEAWKLAVGIGSGTGACSSRSKLDSSPEASSRDGSAPRLLLCCRPLRLRRLPPVAAPPAALPPPAAPVLATSGKVGLSRPSSPPRGVPVSEASVLEGLVLDCCCCPRCCLANRAAVASSRRL